jgi:hypothetical protein
MVTAFCQHEMVTISRSHAKRTNRFSHPDRVRVEGRAAGGGLLIGAELPGDAVAAVDGPPGQQALPQGRQIELSRSEEPRRQTAT